jgi:NADH-quinone oxidoreductase chain G
MDIIKIDDIEYSLSNKEFNNLTIFQFCYNQKIFLPCFCYHDRLSIAGNCRMCIVQVNTGLGVSCAINIQPYMTVYTNNKRVREARESVLEFLLINHPLDCPICDQGGECDLQDISLMFGSDRGRFYEDKKRSVDNFSNGPLIKTIMTRCIHRTRCVRFANEVSNFTLGILDRGSYMEIGTYYNKDLLDELSGNIIDLCPVGALTSMPYAFKQRPWELMFYSNIDFLDSLSATIRIYVYSNKIVRVLPLLDESINEEWITNKTRFSYDSLQMNRINYPKLKLLNKLIVISWDFAIILFFYYIKKIIIQSKHIIASIGNFCDLQTSLSIKNLFNNIGSSSILYNLKNINWILDFKYLFHFNNLVEEIEFFNFYLLVSCDLRLEAPLLNIRIKKNINVNKNNELFLYSYGLALKFLTFTIKNVGNSILKFLLFLEGKQRFLCDLFFKSFYSLKYFNNYYNFYNKTIFIFGNSVINRTDSRSFLISYFYFLKNKFQLITFNLINNNLGFYSFNNFIFNNIKYYVNKINNLGIAYILGSDNIEENISEITIYQGFIKTDIYYDSNLVLATTAPYEYDSIYLNLEGRYRFIKQVIKSFVGAYNDWDIISLFTLFNKKKQILKICSIFFYIKVINYFYKIVNYFCNFFLSFSSFLMELFYFTAYHMESYKNFKVDNVYDYFYYLKVTKFNNNYFNSIINNYYISDFYTKNSKVMSFSSLKKYKIFKLI